MVCVPCFIVPIALLIWRFILWPLIRPLYVRWYNVPEDGKKINSTIEKLDKLGDDGCPFGCPLPSKTKPKTPVTDDAEKKNS